jgi:hypothetical protein
MKVRHTFGLGRMADAARADDLLPSLRNAATHPVGLATERSETAATI